MTRESDIAPPVQFPGFQIFTPKDEYVPKRSLITRLQRRAPRPLQLKRTVVFKCEGGDAPSNNNSNSNSKAVAVTAAAAGGTSFNLSCCYQLDNYINKHQLNLDVDPIPLLTPLVSPSVNDSHIISENEAK